MRRRNLQNRESNLQERRFFSRKEFTLPATAIYTLNFFDESGRFPNVPGNIQSPNKIVNGMFTLEGIGFGAYIRDAGANQNQPILLMTTALAIAYNSLLNNSALRISEGNKTIYECPLVDLIHPIVNTQTGGTPLLDTNLVPHESQFTKIRLNVPYLLRQEQTFAFELIGNNLSNNTAPFILYAEMLGRFQFNAGYGNA